MRSQLTSDFWEAVIAGEHAAVGYSGCTFPVPQSLRDDNKALQQACENDEDSARA